jgi:cell division protein FtsB
MSAQLDAYLKAGEEAQIRIDALLADNRKLVADCVSLHAENATKDKRIAELESSMMNLEAAFVVNMIHAYPTKSHQEIHDAIAASKQEKE